MQKNPIEIKEKILSSLRINGPSLPVQIAKAIELESLFAGAFLSELAGERAIKISNLKVGGSPLYYLQGQEPMLENFSNYLHGKEKDAFLLLKDKKILKDTEQEPSIRVALRNIKDFAFAIIEKSEKQIFWRFYSTNENEAIEMIKSKFEKPEVIEEKEEIIEEKKDEIKISQEKQLDIFDNIQIEKPKRKKAEKDEFLNEIKTLLTNKNIQLINLESHNNKEVIARVKEQEEYLLLAFNKKKINEKELIKAYKKALAFNLPYSIMIKDNISKKMNDSIEASKRLMKIEKLE